jgi:hypothetical protein
VNDNDRSAILLDLAAQLREHGSWTGETHVQKAAYFLHELLGVPSGLRFVLYRHGPFSFDLRASLNKLEAWGGIQTEEQPWQSQRIVRNVWLFLNRISAARTHRRLSHGCGKYVQRRLRPASPCRDRMSQPRAACRDRNQSELRPKQT